MATKDHFLIKQLSFFTKISEKKLQDFLKDKNIQSLVEMPETIKPTTNQLERLNKLKELSSLYKRLIKYKEYQFQDSEDMIEFLDTHYKNKHSKEYFVVAYLDKNNNLLSCENISIWIYVNTLDTKLSFLGFFLPLAVRR